MSELGKSSPHDRKEHPRYGLIRSQHSGESPLSLSVGLIRQGTKDGKNAG
jgi:hypothetical protein